MLAAVGSDLLRPRRRCGRRCGRGTRPCGLWRSRLGLEVRERHAEVLAVAVDELHLGAGADRRERRGHERVRRAQHRLALHLGEVAAPPVPRPPNWRRRRPAPRSTPPTPPRSGPPSRLRTSGRSPAPRRSTRAAARDRGGRTRSQIGRSRLRSVSRKRKSWDLGAASETGGGLGRRGAARVAIPASVPQSSQVAVRRGVRLSRAGRYRVRHEIDVKESF